MHHGESTEDDSWGDFCISADHLDMWQQLLRHLYGDKAEAAADNVLVALWVTAARCESRNSLLCLRLRCLIESCFVPKERLRVLPGNYHIITVDVPEWSEEWSAVQMCPERYIQKVSEGENVLLNLLPVCVTKCRTREVMWAEHALSLLGGTVFWKRRVRVSFGLSVGYLRGSPRLSAAMHPDHKLSADGSIEQ